MTKNLEFLKSAIRRFFLSFLVIFLFSCAKDREKEQESLFFSNPKAEVTGIDFINELTETRDQNILDYLYFYNGGGVSIGDINSDGLPDIYFTGNQVQNRLYLNKGSLKFEDITETAGVGGQSTWNTGTTMADVNGDGLLDIYVSAVVGVNGFLGHNELFINNGDLTFTERAAEYGLDLDTYSSQTSFFDLDNDGDLDAYILNHAVHTNESFGPANIRNNRVYESGDKLMLNENGKFRDISEQAGIYGGANSYGLGITTADFNNDGFTDVYIGNDFHEDDYYYLNNGDGTFSEELKTRFGHTSRFSMGNDAADINNDGFVDLITLDMLPEDETVLKSSAGDDNVNLDRFRIEKLGYHPQYTRNMLQINKGGKFFAETALMSGVAATDWSWGPLFADFDQDGSQDLFISNGIPRRPNDLDYVKYTSNEQIQKKLDKTTIVDNEVLGKMPSGAVTNYAFKGSGSGQFENVTSKWIANDSIISTGVAYGDLDNDGDLDIVTNNINTPASIYINDFAEGNYLKLKLQGPDLNSFGIGTKAVIFTSEGFQVRQLYSTKAFQSSSEPLIHFGLKQGETVDSLRLFWPGNRSQCIISPEINSTLSLNFSNANDSIKTSEIFKSRSDFQFKRTENFGIDYEHKENTYNDFDVQKLIPHQTSDLGPAVQVADLNNDGAEDIIFGASRFKPAAVYYQQKGEFRKKNFKAISSDSLAEDASITIADLNSDGLQDILIASGGGESVGKNKWLQDRIYYNSKEGDFQKSELLPQLFLNSSVIKTADYDDDGDLDIFIGSNAQNYQYGAIPKSVLLRNDNGKFTEVQPGIFENIGMVNDMIWTDIDSDQDLDMMMVGEWMSPQILENNNGTFAKSAALENMPLNGLWQTLIASDIDHDGDMDYLLGNWGLNTKLKASAEHPLQLYHKDFDQNGLTETIIAMEKDGKYYMPYGLDELSAQLNQMRKKFPQYKDYAGKSIDEIFSKEELDSASLLEVHTLSSGYLENNNGKFSFRAFDKELQTAPIRAMLSYDFNEDDRTEVLVGGNYFGITPYHGRFDAMGGMLMLNQDKILDSDEIGLNLSQKSVKDFSIIKIANKSYLIVTINNSEIELYEFSF